MTTNTGRMGKAVAVFGLVVACSVLIHAHAKLEKTEPAAGATLSAVPPHVQMWFDEALDVKVSKISLTGPSGKVALGATHSMGDKTLMADIKGNMPDGAYTVDFQTAGDDGHLQKGKFAFTLKRAH